MRIGIIGSGNIGATTTRLLVAAGHDVAIANSRGPGSLRDLVAELGDRAHAATVADAARFGDLALVAIPLRAYPDLPADAFTGKIVMDANNYYPERDGQIEALDSGSTTSSELLAGHLPGATVVKAFNTMYYATLASGGRLDAPRDDRLALFIAGDDADAKRRVGELIEQLGYAAVDTGSLAEGGRRQQPDSPIYNRPMTAAEARTQLVAMGTQP